MQAGDIIYCKLSGKRFIIQRVFHFTYNDPMTIEPVKEIEKYLVRYWSKVQDKYFSHVVFPEELTHDKPIFPSYDSSKK